MMITNFQKNIYFSKYKKSKQYFSGKFRLFKIKYNNLNTKYAKFQKKTKNLRNKKTYFDTDSNQHLKIITNAYAV